MSRGRLRIFEHQLHPATVRLLGLPAGLREKALQTLSFLALGPGHGFGVGQGRKRLVALFGHQQPFYIPAEALALGALSKKIVESSGIIFQRTGSGLYGLSLGHASTPPTGTVIRAS